MFTVNCIEKTKIKKKEAGIGPFKKTFTHVINFVYLQRPKSKSHFTLQLAPNSSVTKFWKIFAKVAKFANFVEFHLVLEKVL